MSYLQLTQLGLNMAGRVLIQPFDLNLEAGQCWAVLGLNGSGKTSLLHTLAGIRSIDQGKICLDQQSINALRPRQRARQISLLFQQQQEQFPCTVLESVLIGRHPHLSPLQTESATDRQQALAALQSVQLETFAQRQVSSLSGGEHQRMAIARLLLQDTPFRILDEPTNHLDIQHQIRLLTMLQRQAKEQKLIVMALHDVNLALRFCDHVILLMPGGEVLAGPGDKLLNSETVSRLYQHPLQLMIQDGKRMFYASPSQE